MCFLVYIHVNKRRGERRGGVAIYRNCSEQRRESSSMLNEEDRTTTGRMG